MNLEDHVGDIIRKARAMSGVSAAAAAQAGGISEQELEALETSGSTGAKVDWMRLAKTVGLDGAKLQKIVEGWLPVIADMSIWRELRCISTEGQGLTVNAYLVWDEVTREAALFDTGLDARPLLELIANERLALKHIFITHSHMDHVACLGEIRQAQPKARLHTSAKDAPVNERNRSTDFIHLGSLRITHRDTPGHAEDGTTYIVGTWPDDAPHVAIVGDAIFAGSIGKGNISWEVARQKVREQILSLPADTLICPGHGPLTTVGQEKQSNPFF